MTPPTNVFGGVWSALLRRPRDYYLGAISIAGIFAELLPLLLGNVAFEASDSHIGIRFCTWFAVAILFILLLVAATSFRVQWPHMPLDPTTVAGAVYYTSDPTMSSSVKGMSPSAGLLFGRVGDGNV